MITWKKASLIILLLEVSGAFESIVLILARIIEVFKSFFPVWNNAFICFVLSCYYSALSQLGFLLLLLCLIYNQVY